MRSVSFPKSKASNSNSVHIGELWHKFSNYIDKFPRILTDYTGKLELYKDIQLLEFEE